MELVVNMDYNTQSVEDLQNKLEELEIEFKQYQEIFKEVVENMDKLSIEYNTITKIIESRN